MPDIAVRVTDPEGSPIEHVGFVIEGVGTVTANPLEPGLYVLNAEDDQVLIASLPHFYYDYNYVLGSFPTTSPFSYEDYESGAHYPVIGMTMQPVPLWPVAVFVINAETAAPITESVEFQLDGTPVDANQFEDEPGVWFFPIEHGQTLVTCAPGYECDEREILYLLSETTLAPGDLESGVYDFEEIALEPTPVLTDPGDYPARTPVEPPDKDLGVQCFIATAANDTPLAPDVQFLRLLRDEVLVGTRSGERLFDTFYQTYYRDFSPAIVQMMSNNPDVKELVKWAFVKPLVNYMKLVARFPEESVEELPEPWRAFMSESLDDYEDWVTSCIEVASAASGHRLWQDFSEMTEEEAADDLDLLFTHILRSKRARDQTLRRLDQLGDVPVRAPRGSRQPVIDELSERATQQTRRDAGP